MEITVNSRKYDGRIHRSWKADLLNADEREVVLSGMFRADVDHPDLGLIAAGTRSKEFFWLDKWFSLFTFTTPAGELRNLYFNVNMPPVLTVDVLDYIDLDIDVVVWPDMTYRVLDEEEMKENAGAYGYSREVLGNIQKSLSDILNIISKKAFPM